MAESLRTLRSGFLASSERFPERPALEVDGLTLTYAELRARAAAIAATLARVLPDAQPPLTAVLGQRSPTAFAAILGALFRGHGYVPLNPAFPIDRTRAMLERSRCQVLVVDGPSVAHVDALLTDVAEPRILLLPDTPDPAALAARWPAHTFLGASDLASADDWVPEAVDPNGVAYLLFTSGSTGQPKGVMVAHRNATAFIAAMVDRYGVSEDDRFSQMFDLTFDLSVFDMFVAWERGACLCCPTLQQKMMPSSYIEASGITVWFSVPSTGVVLKKLRKLRPGQYPSLRLSLFCGEALPLDLAEAWAAAAPNAVLENLYGPTELTIACTLYRFAPETAASDAEQGVVPIGAPYPGMKVLVADETLCEVAPGETGELLMAGPQLSLGYWEDPERTDAAFVVPPGQTETYYRTGDRVRRPRDESAPLLYLGRVDNQIKIQGYRVELGEIEAVLRRVGGVDVAVAVGWPVTAGGAEGIVAFVGDDAHDDAAIIAGCKGQLPSYMQPRAIRRVADFPLNANGKVDRKALARRLEADR
ncbi:MAG: amino acid adenylation domain-containing protein [Proteobacteria bacterium]|nr:amino acid adenylation domain-containing protein [Pseudomonadota bacterium]